MRCLSLDLEIHKDDGRILALAAVDERTGEAKTGRKKAPAAASICVAPTGKTST